MDDSGIRENPKSNFFPSENAEKFQEMPRSADIRYSVASAVYYDIWITVAECTGQCNPSIVFSKNPESNGFGIEKIHDINTLFHPLRIIVSGNGAR